MAYYIQLEQDIYICLFLCLCYLAAVCKNDSLPVPKVVMGMKKKIQLDVGNQNEIFAQDGSGPRKTHLETGN